MAKYKHLSIDERQDIEQFLNARKSFKEIGRQLNRDPTTISKEVIAHIVIRNRGGKNYVFNACVKRNTCKKLHTVCSPCRHPYALDRLCSRCGDCNDFCSEYEEERCQRLKSPPYVCNGCKQATRCPLIKHYYLASAAQQEYEATRSESRTGIATSPEELERIDRIITPLIKQGQSIHHICTAHADEIMLNEKTIYNYIDANLLGVSNIHLPRKVRYRKRAKKKLVKLDRGCYNGRTYLDFQQYIKENPDLPIVEMDTVEGKKNRGKVLLTIFFRNCNVMLAFLRDSNTARSIAEIMDTLYENLGHELYCELFPILLVDRGSEFTNPSALECTEWGEIRSRLFYCDPQMASQKGGIEVTHEFIRRILPKGSSFDDLTQEDVDLMMNHINSYTRKKLGNRSAYQLLSFLHGEDILLKLNATIIPADEIILTPKLLKK